jgi:hypothetical protein
MVKDFKELRLLLGAKQNEIAVYLNTSRSVIAMHETSDRDLSPHSMNLMNEMLMGFITKKNQKTVTNQLLDVESKALEEKLKSNLKTRRLQMKVFLERQKKMLGQFEGCKKCLDYLSKLDPTKQAGLTKIQKQTIDLWIGRQKLILKSTGPNAQLEMQLKIERLRAEIEYLEKQVMH